MRVVDRRGRRIRSDAVFVSTFVRAKYPHNGRGPSDPSHYPEAEQERVGFLARLPPGASAPLTISWRVASAAGAATRIDYGKGFLPVPR